MSALVMSEKAAKKNGCPFNHREYIYPINIHHIRCMRGLIIKGTILRVPASS